MIVVYVIAFILAACSLLYELLIAQTMTMIAGNIVVWYGLTVGIFLASMGYGSMVYGARPPSLVRGWQLLFMLEIALTLVGALAVPALQFAHVMHLRQFALGYSEALSTLGFYGTAFVFTALVGLLSGIELPLLIHVGNLSAGGRNATNRVLGWDYIGALAAGVIFPLYLVPYVPLHTLGFLIAAVNAVVALFIGVRFLTREPGGSRRLVASAGVTALLLTGIAYGEAIEQFFLKKYYYYVSGSRRALFDPLKDKAHVYRASSPYQKIDLLHNTVPWDPIIDAYSTKFRLHPSKPKDFYLFLNGDLQFDSNFEEQYHEWFAHVPIIASGDVPRRVMIMGGGDGILHRELVKYDGVQSITHVDIDKRLVTLVKENPTLAAVSEHALEDPRVHTIFADAYEWIRTYEGEPFDAVYLDFPFPRDYNLSRLFSREFYTFVNQHLADDGFVVMDAPWIWLTTRDGRVWLSSRSGGEAPRLTGSWDTYYHTIRSADFKTIVPFFSEIETDNPDAQEALAKSELLQQEIRAAGGRLDGEEAQRKWIADYLDRLWRLRTAFIMFRKDVRRGPYAYRDFGVPTYLLNEKRFALAFPVHVEPRDAIDFRKVNSILRPTLPEFDLADIRRPW